MEVDETDDWMNPPKREPYIYKGPTYPRFLIERKRRLDYVPFERWDIWESYETRAARDEALASLREKHPVWRLRARDELHAPIAYL